MRFHTAVGNVLTELASPDFRRHNRCFIEGMMNFKATLILLFLSFTGATSLSYATPRVSVQCDHQQGGGYWWNYCFYQTAGSTSKDVLYYFHGIHGNEYEWQNSPDYEKVYEVWGAAAPKVISISYGSAWLLAQKNSSPRSGLYDNFVDTAMPTIEAELKLQPAHRLLFGLSMGGFNAAQIYLKNSDLFTKFALACPAITSIGPYSSIEEILAYEKRTDASPADVNTALYLSHVYFPTPQDWNNAAPIAQATATVRADAPPLYVSGGMQDQYGFEEGAQAFVSAVNAKGARAKWVSLPGPHCTWDVEGTALFLIQ
jgi:pimeloyl-ACP methyl ester carboxylesterase